MGKKERNRRITVYISQEGEREEAFLNFLQELFDPEERITLKFSYETGGTSNAILDRALKNLSHSKVYAWFDEDDELDIEHREALEKCWNVEIANEVRDADIQSLNIGMRKPIVIVSTPYSVEGIIIRLFDKKLPNLIEPVKNTKDFEKNKRMMKDSVSGIFGGQSDRDYYVAHLTREIIQQKAKEIEELRLLLTIFDIR